MRKPDKIDLYSEGARDVVAELDVRHRKFKAQRLPFGVAPSVISYDDNSQAFLQKLYAYFISAFLFPSIPRQLLYYF